MSAHRLFSDGAARGNPGPAGAGASIQDERGRVIGEVSQYLGETTNNQAEYQALLLGLVKAHNLKIKHLEVFLDSELVVKQLNGQYRVKHPDLIPLFEKVKQHLAEFHTRKVSHVYREMNQEADRLANLAIDRHFQKK